MKQFGLAALFVVGVAIFTGSPAWAQSTITLTNTGVEPGASGQASLTAPSYVGFWWNGVSSTAY
jgi:hypothetical protein